MGRNIQKREKEKMKFYSPLRYPGGKGRLSNCFENIIKRNKLKCNTYVEGYAGGASIALSLLIEGHAKKIIINDIDRSIYAFWYSVLHKTDKLCNLIKTTPVNIPVWKKQKMIQKNKEKSNLLELGFSTLFLNRTNRSGIMKAGVIGGLNQDGPWKMNVRYNKKDLINKIRKIAAYRDRVRLYNLDSIKLIKSLKNKTRGKTLYYFDPPYYNKGKDLYLNHYKPEDHAKVSEEITKIIKSKWIVTYDNVDKIRSLYKGYKKIKFNIHYSAGKPKKGEEIMILCKNLNFNGHVL